MRWRYALITLEKLAQRELTPCGIDVSAVPAESDVNEPVHL